MSDWEIAGFLLLGLLLGELGRALNKKEERKK